MKNFFLGKREGILEMTAKTAIIAAFSLSASFAAQAFEFNQTKFEDMLKPDFFDTESKDFIGPKEKPFIAWLSAKQDEAHFPAVPTQNSKAAFFGSPVQEAIFRFKDEKLASVYISIFNRGDAGEIDQDTFTKLVASVDGKITEWSGDKGTALKKSKLNSDTNIAAKAWVKDSFAITLKWSSTGNSKKDFKAEYLQLEIAKFDPKDDPRKQSSIGDLRGGMSAAKDLPKNVKKEADGDVHIDGIPMIDQGAKGYCLDAAAARVFRYYGVEVTQHDIAQVAGADPKLGTTVEAMVDGIKKISSRYGVKIREYYKNDSLKTAADFEKYVKKYNSYALKMKQKPVRVVTMGNTVYPDETISQMDPDVLKKFRVDSEKTDMKGFVRDLKASVDKGIPLLWAVKLGIIKEKEIPQASGGHMRLITGYNDKDSQIIYSDSWGADHDYKKMDYGDAWTISSFLIAMDPLK